MFSANPHRRFPIKLLFFCTAIVLRASIVLHFGAKALCVRELFDPSLALYLLFPAYLLAIFHLAPQLLSNF